METSTTAADSGVDLDALHERLAPIASIEAPLSISMISGGRSNLTYAISDSRGSTFVLRRPPHGNLTASAHDVLREFRLIEALHPFGVPVPEPVLAAEAGEVCDSPCFVMGWIGGATVETPAAAARLSDDSKLRMAGQVIDALADLHAIDVDEAGLSDFKRPTGLIERQLSRWSRQLDGYQKLTYERILAIRDLLAASVPAPPRTAIVHGDYKLGNFRVGDDGELLAILDWELAAVGDPLIDLAWLLASWSRPDDPNTWIVPPPTQSPGFPERQWLADRYASATGLSLEHIDYYVAFALWRWSCINESHLARFGRGAMGTKRIDTDAVRAQVVWQLDEADRLLSGRGETRDAS